MKRSCINSHEMYKVHGVAFFIWHKILGVTGHKQFTNYLTFAGNLWLCHACTFDVILSTYTDIHKTWSM